MDLLILSYFYLKVITHITNESSKEARYPTLG